MGRTIEKSSGVDTAVLGQTGQSQRARIDAGFQQATKGVLAISFVLSLWRVGEISHHTLRRVDTDGA